MYKYQIGISYASEQKVLAERIYNLLSDKGIIAFFAEKEESNFLTKNIYSQLINTYEKECKYIVAIISKEYINKEYTNRELSVALERTKNGERCLIPIYTSSERHPKIGKDDYYIDYTRKNELEIVNDIVRFLNNNQIEKDSSNNILSNSKIEEKSLLLNIPRDYKIFISGATGVGKSTIARNLLNIIPDFVIIEEADMLREAVRGENDRIIDLISNYANQNNQGELFNKETLKLLLKYDSLKSSTVDLHYEELNEQCKLILEPLEKVCFRLMNKGMPAIIEGVNLSFEAMFDNPDSLYFVSLDSKDTLFLNLYVNNSKEHRSRLIQRCSDRRDNAQTRTRYLTKLSNIRNTNDIQYEKVETYAKKYNNVYNIDTTGTLEETIEHIITIIQNSTK